MVGEIGLVVLGEEDVDGGFDGAVLVYVIEDNDLRRKLALEESTIVEILYILTPRYT